MYMPHILSKTIKYIVALIIIIALIWAGVFGYFFYLKNKSFNLRLQSIQRQLNILSESLGQAGALSKEKQSQLKDLSSKNAIVEQSQDQLLVGAIAKVSPSVVSIVISKDVPKLQVTYENPFGNDPAFQGIDMRIPVYKQIGTEKKQVGAGSGFIVRSDGYIITNKHVVDDTSADYTVLLATGAQKSAKVVYIDPSQDLAIIKIDGNNYPSVTLGDSSVLKLGQTIAAIGNALGEYSNSVSVGIVSGLNRTIEASDQSGNTEKLTGILQTDAAINPGNSGGPLLDLSGKVVGVNVATVVGSNNIAFSIPINNAKEIISKILGV